MSPTTPAHLARRALYDAIGMLACAEAAIAANDLESADQLARAARTEERVAEFYALSAVLGKDGRSRE